MNVYNFKMGGTKCRKCQNWIKLACNIHIFYPHKEWSDFTLLSNIFLIVALNAHLNGRRIFK